MFIRNNNNYIIIPIVICPVVLGYVWPFIQFTRGRRRIRRKRRQVLYSLTHSLTYSLTHSLTHSFTYSSLPFPQVPLAWVNQPLFDYRNQLNVGTHSLSCWIVSPEDPLEDTLNPIGTAWPHPMGVVTFITL